MSCNHIITRSVSVLPCLLYKQPLDLDFGVSLKEHWGYMVSRCRPLFCVIFWVKNWAEGISCGRQRFLHTTWRPIIIITHATKVTNTVEAQTLTRQKFIVSRRHQLWGRPKSTSRRHAVSRKGGAVFQDRQRTQTATTNIKKLVLLATRE